MRTDTNTLWVEFGRIPRPSREAEDKRKQKGYNKPTHVSVLTANKGNPKEVLNAGKRSLPRSSAFERRIGEEESACAERRPPR